MSRPKTDDPKVSVSLRIRQSVLASYQDGGDDWRDRMHDALVRGLDPAPPKRRASDEARGTAVKRITGAARPASTPTLPFGPQPVAPGSRLKGAKR